MSNLNNALAFLGTMPQVMTTDDVHADFMNALLQQLFSNDARLQAKGAAPGRNTILSGPFSLRGAVMALRDRYSENLCVGGTPISGGAVAGGEPAFAFDTISPITTNNTVWNGWNASQAGNATTGLAWLGYAFSAAKHIRKITFVNHPMANCSVSSLKVQNSSNGTTWNDVATFNGLSTGGANCARIPLYLPVSAPMVYWRLLANANTASASWVIFECEMYELQDAALTDSDIQLQALTSLGFAAGMTADGPLDYPVRAVANVPLTLGAADINTVPLVYTEDLCNGGTAISSGNQGASTPDKAFNNNSDSDCWTALQNGSATAGIAYIGYNFGTPKAIRKISFMQTAISYSVPSGQVQYSDNGTTWVTALSSLLTNYGPAILNIPAVGAHQYWRVLATANTVSGGAWYWNVYEIEMYEAFQTHYILADRATDGTLSLVAAKQKPRVSTMPSDFYTDSLCVGGAPISGGDFPTTTPRLAFDGITAVNPWWGSSQLGNGVGGVAWIGYDFGVQRAIRKLIVTQLCSRAISSYLVQYSDDAAAWTTALTVTGAGTLNSYNVSEPLDIPAVGSHRYWRILANAHQLGNTGWPWGVCEIAMYELAVDLHVYNPLTGIMQLAAAGIWTQKSRVPVGEALVDSAGKVVSYKSYDYGIINYAKFADIRVADATQVDQPVAFGQFTSGAGWFKLPNGYIVQWIGSSMSAVTGSNNTVITSLPIAFPNGPMVCIVNIGNGSMYPISAYGGGQFWDGAKVRNDAVNVHIVAAAAGTVDFSILAIGN